MKRKKTNSLLVWVPTGESEGNIFRTVWKVLSSPVFLIGLAVVDIAAMIYFQLITVWWMWALAPSTIGLAIAAILLRRKAKDKLLISVKQAQKCNTFQYVAKWLENRYLNRIDLESERTQDDYERSRLLYCHLGEALVTLGIYDEAEQFRTKKLTGEEFAKIMPIEFYTDFISKNGIGYVLFKPSLNLIPKLKVVDERVISWTLRKIGLVGWTVERVNYDDDLLLFILKDETVSRAFDFSGAE